MAELTMNLWGDETMRQVMGSLRPGLPLLDELAYAIADDAASSVLNSEQRAVFVPHANDPHERGTWWLDRTLPVFEPARADVTRAYVYLLLRGRIRVNEQNANQYLLLDVDGAVYA